MEGAIGAVVTRLQTIACRLKGLSMAGGLWMVGLLNKAILLYVYNVGTKILPPSTTKVVSELYQALKISNSRSYWFVTPS